MSSFLSFIIGFVLGVANWWALYSIYKMMFLRKEEKYTVKEKLKLTSLVLLKSFIFFGAFFLVVVVFRANVLYLIFGLTLSLIGLVVKLIKYNKEDS